ncbi:DUF4476 domain-containing protein [Niabella hibiscisoli]|uniref:DUF4476 domain-containing protein n=1 Tax=Niabella hibiscisoli TaxID=1825928 RepID=UPI001F10B3D8|nr:DUF4476 domain-containing protein [Niabella hibiscisoli]MCH5717722.1 DUF4476 domain-containing protein [Niabella hibiscisoli]
MPARKIIIFNEQAFSFLALFTLLSFVGFGQGYQVQSKYFVYLQTEPAQPFYIKINGQQITANASGYLILPQLKDGNYKLTVGFPDSKTAEQRFDFKIDSKDKGYLIKDYGNDGWGLFDLQTMAVQKALKVGEEVVTAKVTPPAPKPEPKKETVPADGVSDFTKVLSQAANDPSLLEKPKQQPVEEKPVVVTPPPTAINQPAENKQPATVQERPVVRVPDNSAAAEPVQTKTSKGVTVVYDDRNESGQVDPITIFIPEPKASGPKEPAPAPVEREKKETVTVKENNQSGFKVEEKAAISQPAAAENASAKSSNAACKSIATEDDFLKLRRAMATESNDDSMIAQASKAFKAKCYTTAHIKYLSSMFLSNAGKYNFYAAAYPFIADREHFASLASEIKDAAYRDKFNALVQ